MRNIILLYIVLIIASATGCSRHSAADSTLDRADSLMESRPDSALTLLRAIDSSSLSRRATSARYALLMSQALDKNYIDVTSDSLISIATAYYADHSVSPELMKSLLYHSKVLYNNSQYSSAIISAIKAKELAEKSGDNYWLAKTEDIIADIYTKTYYNIEAAKYRKTAAIHYLKAGKTLNHRCALAEYCISLIYNGINPNKGQSTLDSLLIQAEADGNSQGLISFIYSVKISIHLKNHEYEVAEELMRAPMPHNLTNTIENYTNRANLAIFHKEYEKAKCMIDSAKILCIDPIDSLNVEVLTSNFFAAKGEYSEALEHLKIVLDHQNFIVDGIIKQSVISAQRDYYNAQSELEKSRVSKLKYIIIWSGIFILIATVTLNYIYKIKIRFKNLLIEQKLNELNQISSYAKQTSEHLIELTKNVVSQKAKIEELEKSLSLQQDKNKSLIQTLTKLYHEQWKTINTLCDDFFKSHDSNIIKSIIFHRVKDEISTFSLPRNLKSIETTVNDCMDGIVLKLRTQCPFLKESDIVFLTLIFAGFSPRTICLLTEIKLKYFYNKRTRLNDRILNSNAPDKYLFINAIG